MPNPIALATPSNKPFAEPNIFKADLIESTIMVGIFEKTEANVDERPFIELIMLVGKFLSPLTKLLKILEKAPFKLLPKLETLVLNSSQRFEKTEEIIDERPFTELIIMVGKFLSPLTKLLKILENATFKLFTKLETLVLIPFQRFEITFPIFEKTLPILSTRSPNQSTNNPNISFILSKLLTMLSYIFTVSSQLFPIF